MATYDELENRTKELTITLHDLSGRL